MVMEALLCSCCSYLLLFTLLFSAGLGLDVDVEVGGTAKLPLGDYTATDPVGNPVRLALVVPTVVPGQYLPTLVLIWRPETPLDTATVESDDFKGRLSLVQTPDGIAAQLTKVTSNDTGKDVFYQFHQEEYQGPEMYINLIAPPPNVTSLNVTDVGMDYVNITWPQVIPWDSATVWYYVEYRAPPPNVTSLNDTDIGLDYVNITWPQVIPWDSATISYGVEYKGVNSETWHRTANISATNVTDQLTMRVEGLLPAVWYEFRVVASNRFGKSRSATKKALTKGSDKRSASYDVGMAVGIPVAVLIILGIVLYVCRQRISQRCRNRKDEESGGPEIPLQAVSHANTDSARANGQPPGVDPEPEETDPLLDGQGITTDGVPSGGQPPAAPAGGQPPAAPAGGQPPAAGGQPPAAGGQPPAATGQTDDSILEPLLHYTGTGRGSEVEEGLDWGNGSAHELQPLLSGNNSTETDAVPSSGLEKPFEHRVALYYDDNRENKKKVVQIRGMLEKWGFSVYDLHRDGEGRKMRDYSYSVEKCQHGIFCLPIKTKMDVFQFDVFLANTLQGEDEVPSKRNKILISFHDGDLENTVTSVKNYLADATPLHYEKRETFNWRKLHKMVAIPGCPLTVEEVKRLVGADALSVEELAEKLNIPQEMLYGNHGVTELFGHDMRQKEELIRLWMGREGPEATRSALLKDGEMSRKPENRREKRIEPSPDCVHFESEPVQPSSTVEYLRDSTKDPPTSDDTKEQDTNKLDANGQPPDPPGQLTDAHGQPPGARGQPKDAHEQPPDEEPRNNQLLQQVQDILSEATSPLQEQTAKVLLDLLRGVKDSWQDVQQCCSVIEEMLQLPSIEMLTADRAIAMQLQESYEGTPDNRIAIRTTGDGDCLFHAVGKLLREGREEHTMLLRLGAVVFAVNHQKHIVDELYGELKRADEISVERFFSMISDVGQDKTDLYERLTDVVQDEARKTMNRGEYSGILPIKFLAGFVRSHILLYCPNPTDSIDAYADYHNVLRTPCSCILDSIPDTLQLEVMLVGENHNHFVGLVPTSDDRDLTETDGATNDRDTNDRDTNGSDYSDEATGSGPTAKKEDAKATSQPPSQHGEMQQSAGSGEPSAQDDNELTSLLHVDESKAVPDMSEEKEISMNVDSPGQKDNESTPLLSHDQPPQPGTSNSAPQGPDSEVNIRGGVKYLQKGHYNEMNVGGARPKTSQPKKGARNKGQGKDGRRTPQNKGSYKVNIEGGVGYMQDGDHNVMNIGPQPRSDNNMDAGSTSVPASTDTLSRVVQEEDFQEIQEHIGWKWKNVAKRLGLSDGQIDGIEHDHKEEPLSEKVYQMLRKWKQLKGESATVAVLIQALEQEGLHDVADKMQIGN